MFLRKKLLVCCATVALSSAFAIPSTAGATAPAQAAQGSSLNGRITNVQGGTAPNAEVALVPVVKVMPGMTMSPPAPLPGRVNADGTFTFTQIPPGDYILQADAPGFSRASQEVTLPTTQNITLRLEVLEIPGADTPGAAAGSQADSQPMQNRIAALEQRVRDLESTAVLSEPETRTRKTTVYIDKNHNIYDKPTEGAKKTVTYQRERVYRRQ